jgi:hypothetical protein
VLGRGIGAPPCPENDRGRGSSAAPDVSVAETTGVGLMDRVQQSAMNARAARIRIRRELSCTETTLEAAMATARMGLVFLLWRTRVR